MLKRSNLRENGDIQERLAVVEEDDDFLGRVIQGLPA